jgi:hypothetical protein
MESHKIPWFQTTNQIMFLRCRIPSLFYATNVPPTQQWAELATIASGDGEVRPPVFFRLSKMIHCRAEPTEG